jgi:Cft2 family RNA processing exonuclease
VRVTPYGAARLVTGSCALVEAGRVPLLVDCGLFKGGEREDALNYAKQFTPSAIDEVLLTRAHVDNIDRLPMRRRAGRADRSRAHACCDGPRHRVRGTGRGLSAVRTAPQGSTAGS